MTNEKLGAGVEIRVCESLARKKWWCHRMVASEAGQPCDIVALSKGKGLLIDAKHCDEPRLPTSRIEPNQRTCFKYASSLGVECGFAIEYNGNLFWLPWKKVDLALASQPKARWEEWRW